MEVAETTKRCSLLNYAMCGMKQSFVGLLCFSSSYSTLINGRSSAINFVVSDVVV